MEVHHHKESGLIVEVCLQEEGGLIEEVYLPLTGYEKEVRLLVELTAEVVPLLGEAYTVGDDHIVEAVPLPEGESHTAEVDHLKGGLIAEAPPHTDHTIEVHFVIGDSHIAEAHLIIEDSPLVIEGDFTVGVPPIEGMLVEEVIHLMRGEVPIEDPVVQVLRNLPEEEVKTSLHPEEEEILLALKYMSHMKVKGKQKWTETKKERTGKENLQAKELH